MRKRRLAEKGDPFSSKRVLDEKRRRRDVKRLFAAGKQIFLLEIELVVPVRVVHQLDFDKTRMIPQVRIDFTIRSRA